MKSFEEWCKERQSFMCEDITPHFLSLYKVYSDECYQRLIACEAENEELTRKARLLEGENAALRERLGKAVILPCKVGDTVYQVYDKCDGRNCPYNGYYGQWRCSYEGKQRCKPFIDVKSFCYEDIRRINKTVFVSKEAAEKRLAELQKEQK